jgi:hypothetical protein
MSNERLDSPEIRERIPSWEGPQGVIVNKMCDGVGRHGQLSKNDLT